MKTLRIIAAAAAALLTAVSCENAAFLDRAPYSSTAPENFYGNPTQMRMALVSCYETINTHKIPGLTYCQRGTYGQGLIYLMNAPSDDVVGNATSMGEGVEMEQCTFDESSLCIRQFWKAYYTGINRCNTILAYIDGIAGLGDEEKLQFKAEARFMRAFFYYHLAWNFGGVPAVTDYASKGEEPRSSLKDIYSDLILPDLDYAYANLPGTGGLIQGVSANKYVAAAYIGRICNYLAACKRYGTGAAFVAQQPLNDFAWVDADAMSTKAKTALEDVCRHSPYILNEDYTLNFLECSKEEQHKECLFLAELPLSGSEGYWPNSYFVPTPVSANGWPSAYGGRHAPTYRGFYMYSKNDMRRDWNFTGRAADGNTERKVGNYTYAIPTRQDSATVYVKDAEGKAVIDPATGKNKTYKILHPLYDSPTMTYRANSNLQICTGKFRLAKTEEMQHTYQQHALSYPLMRLADVYLMYAEALYFTGNESEGRTWMNKVLRRAATDDANYAELLAAYHRDDFIEELLESRERELYMEFSRKWDLIRFNRIDAAIASLDPLRVADYNGPAIEEKYLEMPETATLRILISTVQQNWMPYKIWLPISEEQRGVNKNLEQNAGWSADTN